jgi:hypothetical protein
MGLVVRTIIPTVDGRFSNLNGYLLSESDSRIKWKQVEPQDSYV